MLQQLLASARDPVRLAAFGCVVAICCFAQSARASCGDYLAHAGGSNLQGATDPHGPMSPAAPCRGPHCRQAPDRAPLPAPQRFVIVPTRDALGLLNSNCILDQQSTWLVCESEQILPSFCGLDLFRPPRA
jgi:hypothetical protein